MCKWSNCKWDIKEINRVGRGSSRGPAPLPAHLDNQVGLRWNKSSSLGVKQTRTQCPPQLQAPIVIRSHHKDWR